MSDSIQERNHLIALYDCYGQLLTEKQRFTFDSYYHEDLSLAEIAEQIDTSRQAVHNTLQRIEKHLAAYEDMLGMLARSRRNEALLGDVAVALRTLLDGSALPKNVVQQLLMQVEHARKDEADGV